MRETATPTSPQKNFFSGQNPVIDYVVHMHHAFHWDAPNVHDSPDPFSQGCILEGTVTGYKAIQLHALLTRRHYSVHA